MNRIKKTASATKEFVVRHKTSISVVSTAAMLVWIHRISVRDHQNFIAEHGLTDQYIKYMSGE